MNIQELLILLSLINAPIQVAQKTLTTEQGFVLCHRSKDVYVYTKALTTLEIKANAHVYEIILKERKTPSTTMVQMLNQSLKHAGPNRWLVISNPVSRYAKIGVVQHETVIIVE
jgi:hypothetical protein